MCIGNCTQFFRPMLVFSTWSSLRSQCPAEFPDSWRDNRGHGRYFVSHLGRVLSAKRAICSHLYFSAGPREREVINISENQVTGILKSEYQPTSTCHDLNVWFYNILVSLISLMLTRCAVTNILGHFPVFHILSPALCCPFS